MYVSMLSLLVSAIPLNYILHHQPDALFVVRAFSFIIAASGVTFGVYIPKLHALYTHKVEDQRSIGSDVTTRSAVDTNKSSANASTAGVVAAGRRATTTAGNSAD